ncbi:putative glyoxylase CFP32 [Paractinoplanes abujensis]|uniref:Putative enzyme related to lactoylglutathione lyase n=1 Tax=Paractinoplanes abujensis TaxID=882441 RepID=A0A7W7CWA8_9ACTN|nr:VOC family protein [Actinoplanes abujensis]MBB4695849.1 putative enzyme related to lactoylglutathione lyase [Actinoplanes abujensis]GID23437.1 putative glyoxylase CFP32 [Actinoplanes abujensis]
MTPSTPGSPTWVDLGTADPVDAERFYTALFGWTSDIAGDYITFLLNGRPVAGAGPLYGVGQPTAWSTYIGTDDADGVAARVAAADGKVLVPPFDVQDQGRMAAFLDPGGAPFSVWEPGTMRGAELFDVPGALTWNELNTRDLDGSMAFYQAVFGWQFRNSSMSGIPYVVAKVHETPVCGIQPMLPEEWHDDVGPHWTVYFAVPDCDAATDRALALGGAVVRPPTSLPIGRYAVLADAQGGWFAVLAGNR